MSGRVVQYSHSYDEVECELGRISLVLSDVKLSSKSRNLRTENDEGDGEHKGYAMRVSFLPADLKSFRMIVASTFYEAFSDTSSCISHLVVNRVVPAGSRVFDVVRQGQLQELLEMIQRGEASLKDHDEYGASLLMVSS